ncbi:MAG: hypothetical protein J6T35_02055 [Bacteroidales bacterium]|nr:hypothetical protein [Bacteroidales bacterium]
MNVTDLNREQLTELKQNYLCQLADEGMFAEMLNVDYDAPSWGDLANADEIVPDDVIFEHYRDSDFVEDDFCVTGLLPGIDFEEDDRSEMPWDYGKHFN